MASGLELVMTVNDDTIRLLARTSVSLPNARGERLTRDLEQWREQWRAEGDDLPMMTSRLNPI